MTSRRWWWALFKNSRDKEASAADAGYLARYDAAALAATSRIIARYSSSFSLATRLLGGQVRRDIRSLYAVVRIADEIVDGTAGAAGLKRSQVAEYLDSYEQAVLAAPRLRFHADPVLHAYAISARRCGFRDEHMRAFFSSMRRDLTQDTYAEDDFAAYVYGSAEVIGLLCLDAFLAGKKLRPGRRAFLEDGAQRLGAAFQKINFLRDLAEDREILGRSYFPRLATQELDEENKEALIADIRSDLAVARAATGYLPLRARVGVNLATELFSELAERLAEVPAAEISLRRVRVPAAHKALLIVPALFHSFFPGFSPQPQK